MTMTLSAEGAAFIRRHEGFRERYYLDSVGVGTIGIGFTWRSTSFRAWWAQHRATPFGADARISEAEADEVLQRLVAEEYGKAVNRFLGRTVPQHVFDAMCSMVFNCGARSLTWRWAAAAKSGDYFHAASLLRITATKAAGKRLQGLVNRRAAEANLLEKGLYSG